jgi:hypothetical protein
MSNIASEDRTSTEEYVRRVEWVVPYVEAGGIVGDAAQAAMFSFTPLVKHPAIENALMIYPYIEERPRQSARELLLQTLRLL